MRDRVSRWGQREFLIGGDQGAMDLDVASYLRHVVRSHMQVWYRCLISKRLHEFSSVKARSEEFPTVGICQRHRIVVYKNRYHEMVRLDSVS